MHVYVCTYTYARVRMCVYVRACTYMCVRTCVYVCVCTYVHVHTYTHICTCTYVCVCMYVYICTCTHVHLWMTSQAAWCIPISSRAPLLHVSLIISLFCTRVGHPVHKLGAVGKTHLNSRFRSWNTPSPTVDISLVGVLANDWHMDRQYIRVCTRFLWPRIVSARVAGTSTSSRCRQGGGKQ